MKVTETEAEAVEVIKDFVVSRSKEQVFCPVIKDMCDPRCICYKDPYYNKRNQNMFYSYEWSCTHVLISRFINVEQ
jgi:hypothetical protein